MQSLIDKIRKAREKTVKVEGHSFTIRRPTDMEMAEVYLNKGEVMQSDILHSFVIGWDGITELDVIPGGTAEPVAFNIALFDEWIADKPALWSPLVSAITGSYADHAEQISVAEKKPEAG